MFCGVFRSRITGLHIARPIADRLIESATAEMIVVDIAVLMWA